MGAGDYAVLHPAGVNQNELATINVSDIKVKTRFDSV